MTPDTQKAALDALIEALEAGRKLTRSDFRRCFQKVATLGMLEIAADPDDWRAMAAAVALLEALLPGWSWGVGQNVWHRHFFAHVNKLEEEDVIHDFGATNDTPARALLIATLKAWRDQ